VASDLDALVAAVRASRKNAAVSLDLIARIGSRELQVRRNLKGAIKATKRKLHQVAGAYWVGFDPKGAAAQIEAASHSPDALRTVCRDLMSTHASTRERLSILDVFFARLIGDLFVRSVLDVACGLNPLAVPWMPLARGATYVAMDIDEGLMAFLGEALPLLGVTGCAIVRDALSGVPERTFDIAFLLKAVPCLEQIEDGAGARILDRLRAEHVVLSFPTETLGGHRRGMVETYRARLHELVSVTDWRVVREELFSGELAFLLQKEKRPPHKGAR